MKKIKYFLFFFLLCSLIFCEVKQIDSLLNYVNQANNDSFKVKALIKISALYMQNEPEKALQYAYKAKDIASKLKFTYGKTEALYQIAYYYYQRADLKDALEKFIDVERFAEQNNVIYYQLSALNNIAVINARTGNYKIALEYFNKMLKLTNNTKMIEKWVLSLVNIGNCYVALGNPEKSINFYLDANNIVEENNFEYGRGLVLNNLSYAYYLSKDYVKSEIYSVKAYQHAKKIKDVELILESSVNLTNVYIKLNKSDLAIKFASEGIIVAKKIQAKKQLKDLYEAMVEAYLTKADYKNAFMYQKQSNAIKDSIYNEHNAEHIAEMQAKYDTEKKNKEIELKETQLKMKDFQLIAASVIFVILVTAFVIVFNLFNKQKLANLDLVKRNLELVHAEHEINRIKNNLKNIEGEEHTNKYKNSTLSDNKKERLLVDLNNLMETDKPYLDKDLTIEKLATSLDINSKYLSQVINEEFNENFSNYVNEFRIKEARRLLIAEEYANYSIEAIANFVGFNSKPSFNAAFKKFTGITPSVFKDSMVQKV